MYDDLVKWIKDNGGYIHPDLHIVSENKNNHTYCSVHYKQTHPVKLNSKITQIPHKLTISRELFEEIIGHNNYSQYIECDEKYFKLIVALIYEAFKKESSFYYPYIRTLPNLASFESHPILLNFFNKDTFSSLDSLNLEFTKIIRFKSNKLENLIKSILSFTQEFKIFDSSISENELKEKIIWAYMILSTRAWSDNLIPYNDLFNHKNSSNVILVVENKAEAAYSYFSDSQFQNKNSSYEIYGNYGHYALMSLQSYYNFLAEDGINSLCLPFSLKANDEFAELKTQEIKKCNFSQKKILLSNNGVSKQLFVMMRILSLDKNEYKILSQKKDKNKYYNIVSYKNELRSIRLLIHTVLNLKKENFSLEIMNKTYEMMKRFESKKVLLPSEQIMKNVCLIKTKEYQIVEDSLLWANDRLFNIINSLEK